MSSRIRTPSSRLSRTVIDNYSECPLPYSIFTDTKAIVAALDANILWTGMAIGYFGALVTTVLIILLLKRLSWI